VSLLLSDAIKDMYVSQCKRIKNEDGENKKKKLIARKIRDLND
jgi:hypothetical protein